MKATILLSVVGVALADLRTASQPKRAFRVFQQGGGRGSQNFAVGTGTNLDGTKATTTKGVILYMEPAIFGYGGLANQRNKNYDNFLRSNIDNEQDNRNFNNEAGEDHLPFRTMRTGAPTQYPYKGPLPGGADDSLQVNNVNMQTVLRVTPGEPRVTPLRWNNPHASEIEVNLWIMCADPPTIVPVKKPTCSGEGNQNNIIEWAIPADFNNANFKACAATQCFNGCENAGDCVLQIYAHSVETRQYATAVPIIVQKNLYQGAKLPYNSIPLDNKEAGPQGYDWNQPRSYDLKSMITGKQAGNPTQSVQNGQQRATLADVKICGSTEREGINAQGDDVPTVELSNTDPIPQLDAGAVHLFLCKNTATQRAAERLVNRVVFKVNSIADPSSKAERTENYAPYEMFSANNFNGAADTKQVEAQLRAYDGSTRTVTVKVDLRGAKRWRFRRHLNAVCSNTNQLNEPFADPWMDLSKLQRETCMSAQDPNSNYATTRIQRARIISDVANHAFQNSNYSPYSGQQQRYISRNLQAAAVVHMTSGNRGELGKANLPNAVKQKLKQLNNAVNQIYQNYEKVANKVIDELTKNGGKNGADKSMGLGVQKLGESFRSAEKGATSTKRLKTTTYVPSFNTAGYNQNVIANAIKSRTRGNKAQYADILTPANAKTGQSYIHIYVKTMDKMLAQFAAAESLGIHYLPAVETKSCKAVGNQQLKQMSVGSDGSQQATPCCNGPVTNVAAGGCGATMASLTNFKKRNAQNKQDGGVYAARKFELQRAQTLWNCPEECILQTKTTAGLGTPLTKTSKGTCLQFYSGADGCTATRQTGSKDCSSCVGAYNNVAPTAFSEFQIGITDPGKKTDLTRAISRLQTASDPEPLGPVLKAQGQPLAIDDTAICHTESSFTCEGAKDNMSMEEYEKLVNDGKCSEIESKKIDHMCDDGPCDNEPNSLLCRTAKARCEVDPDSGEMCMPGNENDPCIGCVPTITDGAEVAAVAFTSLFVLASVL